MAAAQRTWNMRVVLQADAAAGIGHYLDQFIRWLLHSGRIGKIDLGLEDGRRGNHVIIYEMYI